MISLNVSNLTHEFDERVIFDNISFRFQGNCLAVTGPNGSGKSTLLRVIAGLLVPYSGSAKIIMDGCELSGDRLRNAVGMAAPDVSLYSELTSRENLEFFARCSGLSRAKDRISSVLDEVGLSNHGSTPFGKLSSGLRQRARIAAAILSNPGILLLDEPSTNLDIEGIGMLKGIIAEQRKSAMVVIATNDPQEAALAEEIINLESYYADS